MFSRDVTFVVDLVLHINLVLHIKYVTSCLPWCNFHCNAACAECRLGTFSCMPVFEMVSSTKSYKCSSYLQPAQISSLPVRKKSLVWEFRVLELGGGGNHQNDLTLRRVVVWIHDDVALIWGWRRGANHKSVSMDHRPQNFKGKFVTVEEDGELKWIWTQGHFKHG